MKRKTIDQWDEKNPSWKGDKVGYSGLHHWVRRRLLKPVACSDCKKIKDLDLANISGEYKRDLADWEWLCRLCHMKKDGRLVALALNGQFKKGRVAENKKDNVGKICVMCGAPFVTLGQRGYKEKATCSTKCRVTLGHFTITCKTEDTPEYKTWLKKQKDKK